MLIFCHLKVQKQSGTMDSNTLASSASVNPTVPIYRNKLSDLNTYLSDKTYVNYSTYPTQLDREIYDKVAQEYKVQNADTIALRIIPELPHVSRWFTHISSFGCKERLCFPQSRSFVDLSSSDALILQSFKSGLSLYQYDTRVCTHK